MTDSLKFTEVVIPETIGTSCWACTESSHVPGQPGGFFRVNFPRLPLRHDAQGRPALCRNCVYELGRVAGMIDPDQTAALLAAIHTAKAEAEEARAAAEATRGDLRVVGDQVGAIVIDLLKEREVRRPDEAKPKVSA